MKKTIILGTDRSTRGGITSVIRTYESTKVWRKWNCIWISTYNDKSSLHKIIYFLIGFLKFILKLPFSKIIHIHLSWRISAVRKFPFFILSYLFKKKIIVHLHSGAEPIINSKLRKLYNFYFQNADLTILLANSIKHSLENIYSFKKGIVLYNSSNISLQKKIDSLQKYILFTGHINDNKGIFDLLNAFSLVCKNHPSWKLVIAGIGDVKKLNFLINKYQISEQVVFIGWVDGSKKAEIFNNANIFCLPTYNEGFPMSVVEAWACELPVITTPVGGLVDILDHKKNALVFEPGNIKSLSNNIDILIKDKDLRNKLIKESKKLTNTIFNLKLISEQLNKIYTEI